MHNFEYKIYNWNYCFGFDDLTIVTNLSFVFPKTWCDPDMFLFIYWPNLTKNCRSYVLRNHN